MAIANGEGSGQVFFEREATAAVAIEIDALLADGIGAAGFGETGIEGADFAEGFVGPIAAGGEAREADAFRLEDGVPGDLLGGVEVLGDQRGRHGERVTGVGEAFSGGAVGGKLFGRVEGWDAGEVPDGVGVFGVIEAAQDDGPRVSGAG